MNYEKAIKEFIARNACHNGYCDSCLFECRIATKEFEDELRNLLRFATAESDKYPWHDLRKDTEDLPKNEVEVEIAYKAYECIKTTRAIYEDGTMHSEDSDFFYTELDEWCEYCEETDDYIIPKGWFEAVHSSEYMCFIDREVIAWRHVKPFEVDYETD